VVRAAITQVYLPQKKLLGRWVEAVTEGVVATIFIGGKALQAHLWRLESTTDVVTEGRGSAIWERSVKASPIPYTFVRATQFFEFVGGIAQSATEGQTVPLPPVLMQPVASDDVAAVMADVALAEPLNGTVDLAGPEPIRQDDLVRQFLNAPGEAQAVITYPKALYFGIDMDDQSLTPGDHPRLGSTRFEDWLSHNAEPRAAADRGGV
jgi:hypothetical protein